MINITFPDGSVRQYEAGVTGLQIAESISSRLAQDVLACGVNGETVELNRPINEDASIQLFKWDDKEGKHAFWHTSAHLMAEALQELYPGTQFGIGPAIENGFYYDIMPAEGVVIREAVFADIEKKCGNEVYQINLVCGVDHTPKANGTVLKINESGVAEIDVYVYPERITEKTKAKAYEFELSPDVLEILPYGVAADLLKSDVSAEYGSVYATRYETMLKRLDPRYQMSTIYVEGGVDL